MPFSPQVHDNPRPVNFSQTRVAVVGGGPAGLMAAIQSAGSGAGTLLLEKMPRCGLKLRLTGKGRCNLTNTAGIEDFLAHFGEQGPFLRNAFHRFFNDDLRKLLEDLRVQTVVERGGRVFPVDDSASSIADALIRHATQSGAVIACNIRVKRIRAVPDSGFFLDMEKPDGRLYSCRAEAVILATGGLSYPGTGSSGDGYGFAGSLGHSIVPLKPALVPLVTEGKRARRLQGLSLKNVKMTLRVGNRERTWLGEMLFTHFGLSGPIVLSASRYAVEGLDSGKTVTLSFDLKPALDDRKLDARILRELSGHGRQQWKNLLKKLIPLRLVPLCCEETHIDETKPCHQVTAEDRKALRHWLKHFSFQIVGHRGWDEAIVTSGGVRLSEVTPNTLESKTSAGLYVAGELLDLQADTGGYNLQAAFSTGWLAGRAAAEKTSGKTVDL
ncbi:NAD(P)/FAD-dependent oxidoreductase [bacterium]|nr:NAD(P)/FAD-dependent oxidoreductase [bacterium]